MSAAPASNVAMIEASKATASASGMIKPISGMPLKSNGDKRINKNITQIASQSARQHIEAVRSDNFVILGIDAQVIL